MQPPTCLLYAFTLSTSMIFGAATMAAELPKEGTFKVTYSGFATFKATPVGKERVLIVWDDNGLSVGQGIMDHATWHGFGTDDITGGMVLLRGYYVATDPDGDKIVSNMIDRTGAVDAKDFSGTATLTTGTGKYAGISGSYTYACISPNQFRTAAEGTMSLSCTNQGSYKLP